MIDQKQPSGSPIQDAFLNILDTLRTQQLINQELGERIDSLEIIVRNLVEKPTNKSRKKG